MYFFTADEHYGHKNILKYQSNTRKFKDIREHDNQLIKNHNQIVKSGDTTIHIGDFSFHNISITNEILNALIGNHIILKGSHDKDLFKPENIKILSNNKIRFLSNMIYEIKPNDESITCCHYILYSWPKSHYGSWHLHGHHHGRKIPIDGKFYDVGIDNNNLFPVSLDQIEKIMETKPNTWNYLEER